MQTKDFDYHLPPELIAQQPAAERTQARLMLVNCSSGALAHYRAADLPSLLQPGDLLILNDTRVIPARVFGRKQKTGGRVEVLFIMEHANNLWEAFLHASGRPRAGDVLLLANGKIKAVIQSIGEYGRVKLEICFAGDFSKIMEEEGLPPLPPYIKRPKNELSTPDGRRQRKADYERYQTVYAKVPGAIAAPTAGLHFSENLIAKLHEKGVQTASVTLHVGPGTFIPVKSERVEGHKMEPERYIIEETAAQTINNALDEKRRIVAVGTTVVRALESAAGDEGRVMAGTRSTDIFIYPPYHFKIVGALLTNFHLPRSTLLMLVSAFADRPAGSLAAAGSSPRRTGRELIRCAYEIAVKERYRFYSYGDCMLIL